jgi:hypothetical protein
MIAELSGIWAGTVYTDGLTYAQGLGNGEGWGGPPRTHRITLSISSQGDYKNFSVGQIVSPISGQVGGLEWHAIPVSGFIDDKGRIKLVFYGTSPQVDWTFNGQLRAGGIQGDISGSWTRMSWSNGLFLYHLGTMSVQKRGFIVNRVYLTALGRTSDGL